MKYYNTCLEEQESIINIDYQAKTLTIYSSRKSVIERLINKLGNPTSTYTIDNLITGASWKIPFKEKNKIRNALSKTILIAQL